MKAIGLVGLAALLAVALAPGAQRELARLGPRAMLAGALASWSTAAVAGLLP